MLVALDTRLSENLLDEGFAREFVHYVQNLRKASGLEVSDRIEITYATSERLRRALQQYADYVQTETLCVTMRWSGAATDEADNINGEPLKVFLKKCC